MRKLSGLSWTALAVIITSIGLFAGALPIKAGGQATVTRNSLSTAGSTSSSYSNPVLQSWQNTDSIAVTIKSNEGMSLTIAPGQTGEYAFTKTTTYFVDGYPSATGTVVLTDPLHTTSVGATTVALAWGPYTSYDSTPVIGYRVYRTTDNLSGGTISWSTLSDATNTTYTDTSVVAGSQYSYLVNACYSWTFCAFHTNQITVTTGSSVPTDTNSPAANSPADNTTTTPPATNSTPATTATSTSPKTTAKTATPVVTSAATATAVPAISRSPLLTTINGQAASPTVAVATASQSITLVGTAAANDTIFVAIHSDDLLTAQTKADQDGNWSITIPVDSLEAGQHTIALATKDNDPTAFTTMAVFGYTPPTTSSNTDLAATYWAMGFLLLALALVLIVVRRRRRALAPLSTQNPLR